MTTSYATDNDDDGSLKVGAAVVEVGDGIRIVGEEKIRVVTSVFGRSPKTRAACRGSGAFPIGHVQWELVPRAEVPAVSVVAPVVRARRAATPVVTPVVKLVAARALTCELFRGASGWRPARPLHVVGFDSAWTRTNIGGLAAVRAAEDGLSLAVAPRACSFADAATIVAQLRALGPVLLAIDQPLVVANATGRRPVDGAVAPAISRRRGGVQPANTGRAGMFDAGAPIWEFLKLVAPTSIDPRARPGGANDLWALEVFPALATVGMFPEVHGGALLKYNPQRRGTFSPADWAGLTRAVAAIAGELGVVALVEWARRAEAAAPTKALQDELDAVLCACVGLLCQFAPETMVIVGDVASGYICAPASAAGRPELADGAARAGAAFTVGLPRGT